jgi:hypothetical protein
VSKDDEARRKANADRRDSVDEPAVPLIPEVVPAAAQSESPHDFVQRRMREMRQAARKNSED